MFPHPQSHCGTRIHRLRRRIAVRPARTGTAASAARPRAVATHECPGGNFAACSARIDGRRRPAAIPITYRHRARGRPACCCARPCPWRDSPNRPTPESPRCRRRTQPARDRIDTARIRALPDQAPLDDSAARPAPAPSGDPDGGARLHVRAFRLQGNLHVDTDALQTQLADLNGSEQDLTGLRAAADRITRYYHDQGYLLARVSSAAGNPRRRGRHRRTGRRVRRDPARQPVARERRGVAPGLSVLRPGDPCTSTIWKAACCA